MKNPLPPQVTEVALLGFWGASAIQVSKYTWQAVSSTWSQLPAAGGSGGGNNAVQNSVNKNETKGGLPKNVTGLIDSILHPFKVPKGDGTQTFGINGPITKWLEGLLKSGKIPSADTVNGKVIKGR